MDILNIILAVLGIILLIILIVLALKCIKLVENANNFIIDINKKLNSFNYIFAMIEKVSLAIYTIPKKLEYLNNKIFGNIFKRKG